MCVLKMFLIDIYGLFFLFGLVKLISGYQNLKSTCPKGYQGFWDFEILRALSMITHI